MVGSVRIVMKGMPCSPSCGQRGAGLGHLHEGVHPLLHPGTTRGADQHQRTLLLQRAAGKPGDLLPDDRTHRPTHEREVHHAEIVGKPVELPDAGIDGVRRPRLRDRPVEPFGVRLELERILGAEVAPEFAPGPLIRQQLDVLLRADPAVLAALRTDIEGTLEFVPDVHVTTAVTFLPGIGRNLATLADRSPGLSLFLEPGHYTPVGVEEARGGQKGMGIAAINLWDRGAQRQTTRPNSLLRIRIPREPGVPGGP